MDNYAGISNNAFRAQHVYDPTKAKEPKKTGKTESASYGSVVGEPKLSEKAADYYDSLKKKYDSMEFVLVSADQKEQAKAHAGSFANPNKPVVLIDEEKIERMAEDESYRKKYEGLIAMSESQLKEMSAGLSSTGANVKGFGMEVHDDGTASFFAVMGKSMNETRAKLSEQRAEKKAAAKTEAKKAEKKAEKQAAEKKRAEQRADKKAQSEKPAKEDVITADSVEALMQKVSDYQMAKRADEVLTEEELSVGAHIDLKG